MMDQNTCFAYLNMELPDDIRRLKEAGYYDAAIARIDACLAEDWTHGGRVYWHIEKFCAVCRRITP